MAEIIIRVPTLGDSPSDYKNLFSLLKEVCRTSENIRFDLSGCSFLRPNAVAFLGGTTRLIESQNRMATFDWSTCTNLSLINNLRQSGFAAQFGDSGEGSDGHSIPYREDKELELNPIMDYLTDAWIGKGWVQVSEKLGDAIVGKMWEIYNNAFEHSQTPVGVFSCGQHFSNSDELVLAVVDFGRGIPNKVRAYFRGLREDSSSGSTNFSSDVLLNWAFGSGHTTTTAEGVPRGLGLALLEDFVRVNKGKLEIYSNNAYAIIDTNGKKFSEHGAQFDGTIVQITLRCNEGLYRFKNEA